MTNRDPHAEADYVRAVAASLRRQAESARRIQIDLERGQRDEFGDLHPHDRADKLDVDAATLEAIAERLRGE